MGKNHLVCFCPLNEDPFEPVRERMRLPNNRRFFSQEIDYLLSVLLDLVTDSGFPVLEKFGYPMVWGIMIAVTAGMTWFSRRRGYLFR